MSERLDRLRELGQGLALSPLSADLARQLGERFAPIPSFHEDENFFSASLDFILTSRSGSALPDAEVDGHPFDELPVIYDRDDAPRLADGLEGDMTSSVTLTNTGHTVVTYDHRGQIASARPPEEVAYAVFPVDTANGINQPDAAQELVVHAELRGVLENYIHDLTFRLETPPEVSDPKGDQPYLDPMRGPVDWPHLDYFAIWDLALEEARQHIADDQPLPPLIDGLVRSLPADAAAQPLTRHTFLSNWWIQQHQTDIWEEGLAFARSIESPGVTGIKPAWMHDRFQQSLHSEVVLEYHYVYGFNDLFAHNTECDILGKDHEADREPAGFVFNRADILGLESGTLSVDDISPTHMVVAAHESGNGRDELVKLDAGAVKEHPIVYPAAGSHAMSLRPVTEGSFAPFDMEIDSWRDWTVTILFPPAGALLWLVDALCAPEDKRSADGFRATTITGRQDVDARPDTGPPIREELVVEPVALSADSNEYEADDTRFAQLSYPGGWGYDSHGGRQPKIGRLLGILYGGYGDLFEGLPS